MKIITTPTLEIDPAERNLRAYSNKENHQVICCQIVNRLLGNLPTRIFVSFSLHAFKGSKCFNVRVIPSTTSTKDLLWYDPERWNNIGDWRPILVDLADFLCSELLTKPNKVYKLYVRVNPVN